jgi:serpin B
MKCKTVIFLLLQVTLTLSNQLQIFTSGNNYLKSSIYRNITTTKDFVISPFSLEVILALTQSGAKGLTGEQLRKALRFPTSKSKIERVLSNLLPTLEQNKDYSLHIANKIYVRNNFQIDPDFRKVAQQVYKSDVQNVDFSRKNEAMQIMNNWVANRTNQKIQNLIDGQSLTSRTRAVLINALYFQGNWSIPFDSYLTSKRDFYRTATDVVAVDMMSVRDEFNYYEDANLGAKFLELPFDGDMSMVVVLPHKTEGLAALEKRSENVFFSPRFTPETVRVKLPKFKIETQLDFQESLKNIGVTRIFDQGDVDLSGIAGVKGELVVNKVVQKSFIEVNEQGVEAAAATYVDAIVPLGGNMPVDPPKEFVADHPFIFFIKFKDLILFAGKVSKPNY